MPDRNPDTHASRATASEAHSKKYEAPAILWEQPFVALAQISQCNIPGESECIP